MLQCCRLSGRSVIFYSSFQIFYVFHLQEIGVVAITSTTPLLITVFACDDVVVVELPQTPEVDPQKRWSCAWKADEIITVGAWVQLVMAMVGWVEMVVGMHAVQFQVGLVACRSTSRI